MAISLRIQPSAEVPNPSDLEGLLYVNGAGKLTVRLSDGTEREAQVSDGSSIFLNTLDSPPEALPNRYRLFSKDAGGANLAFRAPDGTVSLMTSSDGLLSGTGAFFKPVGQVEAIFSAPAVVPTGTSTINWNPGLHFELLDGYCLVPVWVEVFMSGQGNLIIGTGACLLVFAFGPGPGTPQSRIIGAIPPLVDGQVAQQFFATAAYGLVYPYYNNVVNGDEVQFVLYLNIFTTGQTPNFHATAIMGEAIAISKPTP